MAKRKRFYFPITIIFLIILTACGGGEEASTDAETGDAATVTTTEEGKLTFGSSGLYKPFNYEELDGEMAGFEVDLGNAIAEEMGLEPNPVFTQDFGALIEEVNSDRLDVIMGSLTITEERAEAVDFSEPYYVSGGVIFVHEDTDDIESMDDLVGRNVGVITASTYEDLVLEYIDEDNLATYQSDNVAITDLAAGTDRLDAVMTDKFVGLLQIEEQDLPVKAVGDRVFDEHIGAAVRKGNQELLDEINRALEVVIENGTYDEISQKWFGENILE
ncbi:transporter substrate-binding domain-containing protein [Virgibacillus sp. YIM 98842]|uniref:transporter substrate-binding domain-containing protein n=1 Tax=Virgibacillus sp. YIM 98842 TaxID=2663533 RepID=UPI0013DB0DFE|nr:transporter substrate-binding domain-containing protein [Virgibacillus sp. YIM 98842]